MFGLYTKKEMKRLAARLKEDYSAALARQQEAFDALKEENRSLSARLSKLEGEREQVADALIRAEETGERIKKERELSAENERREFELLAEKCRLLSERLLQKYPDEEDGAAFAAFTEGLREKLEGEEESGFNLDDVLSPKEPLDLGKLCRELGLMEEGE